MNGDFQQARYGRGDQPARCSRTSGGSAGRVHEPAADSSTRRSSRRAPLRGSGLIRGNGGVLFAWARCDQRRGQHVRLSAHHHYAHPDGRVLHGQPEPLGQPRPLHQ